MTTAEIIRLHEHGAPDVLRLETADVSPPAPGEVQLRQTVIGFNYIDTYQRAGTYKLPLPSGLGHEAAGVVEAVGEGVTGFRLNDRAAYINAGLGAYATRRNVRADTLVKLPDAISDEDAAAVLFKAFTAWYLIRKTYPLRAGDIALVHAAAGGVGLILTAWAAALGATVIGTAGSAEKCARAVAAGAKVCINYREADWVAQVVKATGGQKANVVYDSVGRDTFLPSLDCAAEFGTVVLFGAASGAPAPLDTALLSQKGCLYVTRPTLFVHAATPERLREGCVAVFDALAAGHVRAEIGARFPLKQAAEAHRAAEARTTSGAILLLA